MADKYVRKTGSDSNGGTGPSDAYLTIQKAVDNISTAGDTIYIGAGVYREEVDLTTSGATGSSGSPLTLLADITGANTGDAGLVIITAFDSETAGPARANAIQNDASTVEEWWTFQDLVLVGGTSTAYGGKSSGTNAHEGLRFEGCVFAGGTGAGRLVVIDFADAASPTNDGPVFDGCLFCGPLELLTDVNATSNKDRKVTIQNCVFLGGGGAGGRNSTLVNIESEAGSGTLHGTGFAINNCVFHYVWIGVRTDAGLGQSSSVTVRNSTFLRCNTAFMSTDSATPSVIDEDYNILHGVQTARLQADTGANTDESADVSLLGSLADWPLYRKWGWSPYVPYEPIRLQDDSYAAGSIGFAAGTGADAPTATDALGRPRPMHGTVEDAGAVEGRARAEKETTTVRTGSNAIRLEGQGYHDFLVPVNAQSTTVSVYGRFTGTPSTKPKMEVTNIPGVADQTDTMTGAADTWEELTATFTPTAQGVCRVRVWNQDTGSANCYFDDLTVT